MVGSGVGLVVGSGVGLVVGSGVGLVVGSGATGCAVTWNAVTSADPSSPGIQLTVAAPSQPLARTRRGAPGAASGHGARELPS